MSERNSLEMLRRLARVAVPLAFLLVATAACSTGTSPGDKAASPTSGELETEWRDFLGPSRPLPPEEDLRQANAFYETADLPEQSLPQGLVQIQVLTSLCIESMGFPIDDVLDRQAAMETGMFFHWAGNQTERFDEVNSACEIALYDRGLLMGTGREANERLYELYVSSQQCLEKHRHETVTPPTKESFIESPGTWYPWEALLPIGEFFTPTAESLSKEEYRPFLDSLEDCPRP